MKAVYQGVEGMVTIGSRPLKPGDVLTDSPDPGPGVIFVDTVSLNRLADRGDFECSGPGTIIAPRPPADAPEVVDARPEEDSDG